MMSLTPRQAELLDFITRYQAQHNGVSPTFSEMQQALGWSSRSAIHRVVVALEERGRLARRPYRQRALEVLDAPRPLDAYSTEELKAELLRRLAVEESR